MSRDIGSILSHWPDDQRTVSARIITGNDGQPQLQMRLHCGLLQMHLDGRPDGRRPHNHETFLDYLDGQLNRSLGGPCHIEDLPEDVQQTWGELDREMTQFYHRRLALLAVASDVQNRDEDEEAKSYYRRAVRDADYTLRAMDLVRNHSEDEDHIELHERFRPFVLWHRTIAVVQQHVINRDFDEAIEQIKLGREGIAHVYADHGLSKWLKHDPSVAELRDLEDQIRRQYGIRATLNEQLESALATENYEQAAQIRDQLKAKGRFGSAMRLTAIRPMRL